MNLPKVSIICLCYNQARFIPEAIASVAKQTYPNLECIAVNDFSTDDTREVLDRLAIQYPWLKVLHNETNLGMCASFNRGMEHSSGDFLIDLASDDVMHPERAQKQAMRLIETGAGVVYSDAWIMDETGLVTDRFYTPEQLKTLPEGDLFSQLLNGYFICSPTIMFRRSIMNALGGYDSSLVYEDYDFFIRSSRITAYAVVPEPLTYRREVKGSNSSRWYWVGENPHLKSTLVILKRTYSQLQSEEERIAFRHSLYYHWRQTLFLEVKSLQKEYWELVLLSGKPDFGTRAIYFLFKLSLPWSFFYLNYLRIQQGIKKALRRRAF